MNEVHFSSARTGTGRDDWRTPTEWLKRVWEVAPIGLDPCASCKPETSYGLVNWYGGSLEREWFVDADHCIYVNPPYSQLRAWMRKCASQSKRGTQIIALIPARTDTRAFQIISRTAQAICFVRGRITFVDAPAPAPFPSSFVYWGSHSDRFLAVFDSFGTCAPLNGNGDTMAKKPAKKPAKKRQATLKGFERSEVPEIEEAALEYVEHRDARLKALELETAAKAILCQRLEEHFPQLERNTEGEPTYVFADGERRYTVSLRSSEVTPKVKLENIDVEGE